jgi:hypothetical protein
MSSPPLFSEPAPRGRVPQLDEFVYEQSRIAKPRRSIQDACVLLVSFRFLLLNSYFPIFLSIPPFL